MELLTTGGKAVLCVYGIAGNANIGWNMNGSNLRKSYEFPNASKLQLVNENCFHRHWIPFYDGYSCKCVLEELERLKISISVHSKTQNSFGVFSAAFMYSNVEDSLKSMQCTGVANTFLSLLVIENASFPIAQNFSVAVTNTVNWIPVTHRFKVKSSK